MVDRVVAWLTGDAAQKVVPIVSVTRKELERLARSHHRILIGPWLSEVGFELLYWIPFLNWASRQYEFAPERLIVVSRGGAGRWYRHLASSCVDLFSLWTADEYRQKNGARWKQDGHQPQYRRGELDREVEDLVHARFTGERLEQLHPALMHQLFRPYWYERGAFNVVNKHAEFRPLSCPEDRIEGLPADYVSVRFYFRPSFPDTRENRTFVTSVVRGLARQTTVVLLNTDLLVDDHEDVPVNESTGVLRLNHLMTPENNLEIQTRLIAGSRAFIGTYGGLSYLAPLCGVPALGFYSHDVKLLPAHVDVGYRLGRLMNAPLTMLRTDQSRLLGGAVGSFADLLSPSARDDCQGPSG